MRYFLFALLYFFPIFASAEQSAPNVKDALTEWVRALEAHDVERVVALYDADSVMLSAFAIHPITTPEGLTEYYKKVVAEPGINIVVTAQDVREFGGVAVNTGLYRFQWKQDGEPMDVPARFSFVYVLKDGAWKIISHHSSQMPGEKRVNASE